MLLTSGFLLGSQLLDLPTPNLKVGWVNHFRPWSRNLGMVLVDMLVVCSFVGIMGIVALQEQNNYC